MGKEKFQFTVEFQEDILKFIVQDTQGFAALEYVQDYYFALPEHQIIISALKKYQRKKKKVAGKAVAVEYVSNELKRRDIREQLVEGDSEEVLKKVQDIYKDNLVDREEILEQVINFKRYVELLTVIEETDLSDYHNYDPFQSRIKKAITIGRNFRKEKGSFLVADVRERQMQRSAGEVVFPTPFRQMNRLTNGGGYPSGAVLVVLDKAKAFKTGMLVNLARGYLRLRKNVLVIDYENGEDTFTTRIEQSFLKLGYKEVISGKHDRRAQKLFRRYQRLGLELVTKRFPAYVTNTNHISRYMDELYSEYGLTFDVLIIDYLALQGATSGNREERHRISDAYMDIKNLAMEKDLNCIWTAHHVSKDGYKRRPYCYLPEDVSKAIDIHRHVDGLFGLNRNDEEERNNMMRIEIVDQRHGPGHGRVFCWVDETTQNVTELTVREERALLDEYGGNFDPSQGQRPGKDGDL